MVPLTHYEQAEILLVMNNIRILVAGGAATPIIFSLLVVVGATNYDGYSHIDQKLASWEASRLNIHGFRTSISS